MLTCKQFSSASNSTVVLNNSAILANVSPGWISYTDHPRGWGQRGVGEKTAAMGVLVKDRGVVSINSAVVVGELLIDGNIEGIGCVISLTKRVGVLSEPIVIPPSKRAMDKLPRMIPADINAINTPQKTCRNSLIQSLLTLVRLVVQGLKAEAR